MSQCARCKGAIRTTPNLKYCDPCKAELKREHARNATRINREQREKNREGKRAPITIHIFKQTGTIITDEEQHRHDQALRNKQNMVLNSKIYKPGSAAFKAAAQEIMERRMMTNGHETTKFKHFGDVPIDIRQHAAPRVLGR